MKKVIFACVHNAGRSQMAAAFFNRFASPLKASAISVGTKPAERVHPEVVEAMREVGVDLSGANRSSSHPELAQGTGPGHRLADHDGLTLIDPRRVGG